MAKTDIMTAGLAGGEVSQGAEAEQVVQLKLSELHPFEGHPFQVRDDEEMQQMVADEVPYAIICQIDNSYGVKDSITMTPRLDDVWNLSTIRKV